MRPTQICDLSLKLWGLVIKMKLGDQIKINSVLSISGFFCYHTIKRPISRDQPCDEETNK